MIQYKQTMEKEVYQLEINYERAILKNNLCVLKGDILNIFKIKNSKNKLIGQIREGIPLRFKIISDVLMKELGHIDYIDFWKNVKIIKI